MTGQDIIDAIESQFIAEAGYEDIQERGEDAIIEDRWRCVDVREFLTMLDYMAIELVTKREV